MASSAIEAVLDRMHAVLGDYYAGMASREDVAGLLAPRTWAAAPYGPIYAPFADGPPSAVPGNHGPWWPGPASGFGGGATSSARRGIDERIFGFLDGGE
jgi:hypothetical protein